MSPPIDPAQWYTTGQAAKLIGYSRATLVARIKAGHIKARQLEAVGNGTPHRRVVGSELLRVLGEPIHLHHPEPAPKRRSNAARRDGERALKELGLA